MMKFGAATVQKTIDFGTDSDPVNFLNGLLKMWNVILKM